MGFRERLLRFVLYITILTSCVAIIEPSPHDLLIFVLLGTGFIAGLKINRLAAALFLLLLVWNAGGVLSFFNVIDGSKTAQYVITSFYLAAAATLFACLLAEDTVARLDILRRAYVLGALMCAMAGIAGYFSAFPDAADLFTLYGRAVGFFKDPNVFGPFLIWPALMLMAGMFTTRMRLRDLVVLGVLLFALLLSFSRGAWFHLVLSGSIMVALLYVTAPSREARLRVLAVSIVAVAGFLLIVFAALSVGSVAEMITQRAQLTQSYDVGAGGRFGMQELALGILFDKPLGLGPLEFARTFKMQQHNTYLQAFLVYSWLGGVTYLTLVAVTLALGLRAALIRAPWQHALIVAYSAFVGEAAESFIIDTDHWRHYFLILGIVWGLAAASITFARRNIRAAAAAFTLA